MNEPLSLHTIAEQVQELLQAETAVVALAESSGEQVHYVAAVGKYATAVVGTRSAKVNGLYNSYDSTETGFLGKTTRLY